MREDSNVNQLIMKGMTHVITKYTNMAIIIANTGAVATLSCISAVYSIRFNSNKSCQYNSCEQLPPDFLLKRCNNNIDQKLL